jgi:hypothetical protein
MLPVNAVGERLEGKPHEPFDGGREETGASRPMMPCSARRLPPLHLTHGSTRRREETNANRPQPRQAPPADPTCGRESPMRNGVPVRDHGGRRDRSGLGRGADLSMEMPGSRSLGGSRPRGWSNTGFVVPGGRPARPSGVNVLVIVP